MRTVASAVEHGGHAALHRRRQPALGVRERDVDVFGLAAVLDQVVQSASSIWYGPGRRAAVRRPTPAGRRARSATRQDAANSAGRPRPVEDEVIAPGPSAAEPRTRLCRSRICSGVVAMRPPRRGPRYSRRRQPSPAEQGQASTADSTRGLLHLERSQRRGCTSSATSESSARCRTRSGVRWCRRSDRRAARGRPIRAANASTSVQTQLRYVVGVDVECGRVGAHALGHRLQQSETGRRACRPAPGGARAPSSRRCAAGSARRTPGGATRPAECASTGSPNSGSRLRPAPKAR